MITVVSDTHGTDGHRLEGRTLEAVREAELVVHAGDLTTEAVLDAFEAETSGEFVAVYGNNDGPAVRERLSEVERVEHAGLTLVVAHGHEHDGTALQYLGRQEGADAVVVGHSHRPGVDRSGAVAVVNPGSHADPRWHRPAHVELEPTREGLSGRLVAPDGEVFREFDLAATGRE